MTREKYKNKEKYKKKREKKFDFTPGDIKDELEKMYRKSGSLGKNENLSKENASKIKETAEKVMESNTTLPREEVIKETQKRLREEKR